MLGDFERYHARKKVLGGLLVKKYLLDTVNDTDTCLYKGFDDDREKVFYWNKCNNEINES